METMENNLNAPAGTANDSGAMSWDDVLENDSPDFFIPPEGDYLFQVLSVDRGHHAGSANLPPCDKAVVHLKVETPEGICFPQVSLFVHRKTEFRLSSFFCSIGLKKKGQRAKMDWPKAIGAWGRCHLKPRTFTGYDGQPRTVPDVAWFLDFDPELVKPPCIDVTGQVDDLPY